MPKSTRQEAGGQWMNTGMELKQPAVGELVSSRRECWQLQCHALEAAAKIEGALADGAIVETKLAGERHQTGVRHLAGLQDELP